MHVCMYECLLWQPCSLMQPSGCNGNSPGGTSLLPSVSSTLSNVNKCCKESEEEEVESTGPKVGIHTPALRCSRAEAILHTLCPASKASTHYDEIYIRLAHWFFRDHRSRLQWVSCNALEMPTPCQFGLSPFNSWSQPRAAHYPASPMSGALSRVSSSN